MLEDAMKLLLLIVKNVGRNLLRSMLTALGTMVLVLVVTLVWSVLHLIDLVTAEKSHDLKAIVTERWSVPSRLPLFLRIVARRRRCPQGPSGGRPPHGLDDLAVLRRHARSRRTRRCGR